MTAKIHNIHEYQSLKPGDKFIIVSDEFSNQMRLPYNEVLTVPVPVVVKPAPVAVKPNLIPPVTSSVLPKAKPVTPATVAANTAKSSRRRDTW